MTEKLFKVYYDMLKAPRKKKQKRGNGPNWQFPFREWHKNGPQTTPQKKKTALIIMLLSFPVKKAPAKNTKLSQTWSNNAPQTVPKRHHREEKTRPACYVWLFVFTISGTISYDKIFNDPKQTPKKRKTN